MAVQLSIGIQNGKTIHISELGAEFRGNKCNCICPSYHGALIARLGQGKRTPHFSHLNRECNILHAQQTGLQKILLLRTAGFYYQAGLFLEASFFPTNMNIKFVHKSTLIFHLSNQKSMNMIPFKSRKAMEISLLTP